MNHFAQSRQFAPILDDDWSPYQFARSRHFAFILNEDWPNNYFARSRNFALVQDEDWPSNHFGLSRQFAHVLDEDWPMNNFARLANEPFCSISALCSCLGRRLAIEPFAISQQFALVMDTDLSLIHFARSRQFAPVMDEDWPMNHFVRSRHFAPIQEDMPSNHFVRSRQFAPALVGLLAFHLALVNNAQDALVIWTFSSVLYHGNWREAVKFARENSQTLNQFVHEVSEARVPKSDEALAKEVAHLASLVKSSIDALTEIDSLHESMARYPRYSHSGLVFIPKKVGQNVAELFDVLDADIESYSSTRQSFEIDYKLLGKGNHDETRFVLGRVIMDTMRSGVVREQLQEVVEKEECHLPDPDLRQQQTLVKEKKTKHRQKAIQEEKHCPPLSNLVQCHQEAIKEKKKHPLSLSNLQQEEKVKKQQKVVVKKKCDLSQTDTAKKQQKAYGKKCNLPQQGMDKNPQKVFEKKKCDPPLSNLEWQQEVVKEKNEKQKQELVVVEKCRLPLSSLFR
ncbi:hypothetical protein HHK36_002834 [Tetracentron sinense]|uniref:Uncharacterized protein n=1 Tax=Tetracentron sinense TaxID=13715 RepID=A0A835DN49_TETSI|nr:hypothetical protein HHK36_002834 [Tetracentron sinense]